MTTPDPTLDAELERARASRAPYHEAVRATRFNGGNFVWLYAIGWPTVLFWGFGIPCLVQGETRDGAIAMACGSAWALVVLGVVGFVTGPIRGARKRLEGFAARVGGVAWRSPRPDRVLAWLDRYWADPVPQTLIHDASGSASFAGAEASYAGAQVLVLGLRGNLRPRVHAIVLLAARGERVPDELAPARVELGRLGYVVNVGRSGILLVREHAPASSFGFEALDGVVRLAAELADTAHTPHDVHASRELRAELRRLAIERFKPVVHFDERDLELNAQGRLSSAQRFSSVLRAAAWGALALAAGSWPFYVLSELLGQGPRRDGVGGAIFVIVIFSLVSIGLTVMAGQALRDAVDGHAGLALGPLRYSATAGPKGTVQHWLHCGSMRFSTSAATAYALEAEVPYRVYYAAHSHRLLSLERA
ncbi:MAG TPA: hypothetical protein VGQ57_04515 [Polyangiaceae bacterium]|nr:hypothetical protein [Polyangiaceae bacterium]